MQRLEVSGAIFLTTTIVVVRNQRVKVVMTFNYFSHVRHVSADKCDHRRAILKQCKRYN